MNTAALLTIYNSLVYPNLMYCNSVWGATSTTKLEPLLILQKKLVRVISFKPKFYPSAPLFNNLNILTIKQINNYNCCTYVFKQLQTGSDWFVPYRQPANTGLSARNTLTVPAIMTTHSRQSVRWTGTHIWNSLPPELRDENSFNSFKFKLKKYILNLRN